MEVHFYVIPNSLLQECYSYVMSFVGMVLFFLFFSGLTLTVSCGLFWSGRPHGWSTVDLL